MDANKNNNQSMQKYFDQYLTEKKLSRTPERFRILGEIQQIDSHFEADDLVTQLRLKKVAVSRATVYRTLSLLEACGIIRKIRFDEDHNHYELVTENANHAHLVCTKCREIVEFDDKLLEEIQEKICSRYNYQPERRVIEIYGVCPKCRTTMK